MKSRGSRFWTPLRYFIWYCRGRSYIDPALPLWIKKGQKWILPLHLLYRRIDIRPVWVYFHKLLLNIFLICVHLCNWWQNLFLGFPAGNALQKLFFHFYFSFPLISRGKIDRGFTFSINRTPTRGIPTKDFRFPSGKRPTKTINY